LLRDIGNSPLQETSMSSLTRPDFTVAVPLPAPATRDGGNWSPEPEWENYPADTKAFSLAVEYPDSPGGMLD
jgi:phosphatidylethanolamine-binding protein (PEBP) family uncharacterized protein